MGGARGGTPDPVEGEVEAELAGPLAALETKLSMSWWLPTKSAWLLGKVARRSSPSTSRAEPTWRLTEMLLLMPTRRTSSSEDPLRQWREPRTWFLKRLVQLREPAMEHSLARPSYLVVVVAAAEEVIMVAGVEVTMEVEASLLRGDQPLTRPQDNLTTAHSGLTTTGVSA